MIGSAGGPPWAPRRRRPIREKLDQSSEQRTRLRAWIERGDSATSKLQERAERQNSRLKTLQETVRELKGTITPTMKAQHLREVDHGRAMHQLAALEDRVGRIEEKLGAENFETDDDSLREARSLVDTVRREHDQARVRFQIISSYEERMRRLEAAITDMYDDDMRHPL